MCEMGISIVTSCCFFVFSQVELGWEYSVLGMRELGFLLLETHLPKLIILGSGKLAPESPSAAGYNACVLGKSMLYKCFVAVSAS